MESKGALHLSELTGQTIPIAMVISLLIKTLQPDQSNPKQYARRRTFQQKRLEKAYFTFKLTGPAKVQLASSDKWNGAKFYVMSLCRPLCYVDTSLIFWSVLTVEDYMKEKPDFQINYGANPQINRQV